MSLVGLWERWREPEQGEEIASCTNIVCGANEEVAPLHDRMPVILALAGSTHGWIPRRRRSGPASFCGRRPDGVGRGGDCAFEPRPAERPREGIAGPD
jgi:putative SOS response-associated peptidase YedK